jgi:hypothetical protein
VYVQSADMTGLDNSSTPMPASAVTNQDAWIAAIGSRFDRGNADMAGIIAKLTTPEPTGTCDDLTSSDALYGASSPFPFPVPTLLTPAGSSPAAVGSPGSAVAPAAAPGATQSAAAPSPGGATQAGLNTWPNYPWPGIMGDLRRSKVFPGFPCAGGGQMRPSAPAVSIPVPVVATPSPVTPPSAAPTVPSQASCRTNNICIDMRRGCVRSDQVSVQQQFACSQAGYAGNENFFPAITAQKNLPFLGTPMPNPPPYSDPAVHALDVYPSGVSGWGVGDDTPAIDFSNPWVIGIGAASLIGLLYAFNKGARRSRSRAAMRRVRGY